MKVVAHIIVMLLAAALAAIDTALFYYAATVLFGHHVTWPVVAAVFWVQETVFSRAVRKELRAEGLL